MILIVDDSDAQINQLSKDLEPLGYETLSAINGSEAIEVMKVKSDNIKAILIDFNMPNLNGIETIEKMNNLNLLSGQSIIMLTTETSKEIKERAKLVGIRAWITKPHKADVLQKAIKKIMGDQ